MDAPSLARLDLQTAAGELGVHYQTAYRWVRSGRLGAEMVGGRYLVSHEEIVALDRERHAPKAPPKPRSSRLEHAAENMYEALVAGDETAAAKIARRLADEGAPVIDLMQQVLVPPLHRIGLGWETGDLTIRVEHRAAGIVERLLGDLAINPRGRRRGTAVVVAVAGDRHTLPTTMAAVALRADNWHVHHLGSDLPSEEIIRCCDENAASLAVLTVTTAAMGPLAERTAVALRAAGTPTIVGGAGHTLAELVALARSCER